MSRRTLRHILACTGRRRPMVDVAAPLKKPLKLYDIPWLLKTRVTNEHRGTRCCNGLLFDLGAFKLVAPWLREDDLALPPREDWHAPDCVCTECA